MLREQMMLPLYHSLAKDEHNKRQLELSCKSCTPVIHYLRDRRVKEQCAISPNIGSTTTY